MKFKFIIQTIFLFHLFLISFNIVEASINAKVNFYKIDMLGEYKNTIKDDIEIKFMYNTGESISKIADSEEFISLNPEDEFFCWSGCNIVPLRKIIGVDILKNKELVSRQTGSFPTPTLNLVLNIYLENKTSAPQYNLPKDIEAFGNKISEKDFENKLFITYNGKLIINEQSIYSFLINNTESMIFVIEDILSYNNFNETNISTNFVLANLSKGNYTISLSYWVDKDFKPNMYWKKENQEKYNIITSESLIFLNGSVVKQRSSENKHKGILLLSLPSTYEPDYSTYPTDRLYYSSITSGRIPILLVHGLHGSDDGYGYWSDIPTQLANLSNDVWEYYYNNSNVSNFLTAGKIKVGITSVLAHYSISKLDVVSHSMGGLVTLGHIKNLGRSSSGASITYENNIRKFVIIAAPLHGSYHANRVLLNKAPASTGCNWLANLFGVTPKDISAQAYLDLAFGSEFTWFLNKNTLNNNIDYLTIIGNKGILCVPDETKESNSGEPDDGNDGLVAISSASLLNKNIPLIVLNDYNHANEIGKSALIGKFNAEREVNIINSFIKGDDVETLKSYLSSDDYYIDPNDPSTNPYTKGSVVLKFTRNNYINSVGLKNTNTNEYYNLTIFEDKIHNTTTYNWFYFSSNDPSMGYSNQKYGLTFPSGTYELYVNNVKENNKIEIKPAQTTMQLIELDYDGDGINDSIDKCYTEGYNNLPNNSSYVTYYLDENGCHAGILIKNLSNWQSYNKDNKLSAIQSGTSAFDIGYTSKTINNGSNYQILSADIDADLQNEIIIFSNDYLMIFDNNLDLIAQKQVGNLRGQPDIINYDDDNFLEIIAVLQNNENDNYTVIEYNGTSFNIEQSFDVTGQGGYQNIKCLDFDDDNIIDCIFIDYNGIVHSYNKNSSDDHLNIQIGAGTSTNNPIPAFADFDNDGDIDLLTEHNYYIALVDKDKNVKNTSIAGEYGRFVEQGNAIEYCSNKKHHLRFANLTGSLSIVWIAGCNERERTLKKRSKLIVINNDLSKKFVKKCWWESVSCVYVSRVYTHACQYNDPLIYDYNNDGFDEIIITHERRIWESITHGQLGIKIEVLNSTGNEIYTSEVSGPEFEYHSTCHSLGLEGASYADMNNDNQLDIITTKGIFNLNLTNITNDFELSNQQPIPVDLNQDGYLDLIWSKQGETKIFLSEARPSCFDGIKNQDEIDIDCGGVCGECPDSDNDGIVDRYDKLDGNSSNVITNFGLIDIFIENSKNLTKKFKRKKLVEFKKNNKSLVYFNFDFSSKRLNLSKIIINKQTDNKTGYILVKGVNIIETKTVYIDNLNTIIDTICIKDKEIDSINEISSYCNESNEFLIKCDSKEHYGYNCSNSSNQYKITGLVHSGAIQQEDTINPSFTEIKLNNSNAKINEVVMWNATLTDNFELDNAWFSINDSKQWFNYSPVNINGTSFNINFNETINSSRGNYVCGIFYMNDSAGNTGKTNKSCFFVANTAPILNNVNNISVNESNIITIIANATDADIDNLSYCINNTNFNQSDNIFSLATDYDDAGFYSVKITVTDGYDNDSKIFYINISNVTEVSSESESSSDTGIESTYSSRGIFLKEEETTTETEKIIDTEKEEKETSHEISEDNLDNKLKEKIKKEKTSKITGSIVTIDKEKPSKPIGLVITFGIIFFGLIPYYISNKK